MPHPVHGAAARRDRKLLRIRRLTLCITGGAAAASLGLGTAFAHALPGHSYTTGSTTTTGSTPSSGQPEPRQKPGRPAMVHPQHQKLATPKQAPAPAPARTAPTVSSGGS
jgi:hypothetical protein